MTLPTDDTLVTYPAGEATGSALVLHIEHLADRRDAVLLDTTPFHPVDAAWPDQGPDHGMLRGAGREHPVVGAVVGATDGNALFLGADVPVRPGEAGWAFVVAHLLDDGSDLAEGDTVEVLADPEYRHELSVGHTACHLASLALNAAVATRWSKDARLDGLGNPDFDQLAIESSRIHPGGSVDRFRLNKSLRRKGFSSDGLADRLDDVAGTVTATLAEWTGARSPVRVDRDGERLTDRRYWVCDIAGTTVRIPCGGTHVSSLEQLGQVDVSLDLADDNGTTVLTMTTTANV